MISNVNSIGHSTRAWVLLLVLDILEVKQSETLDDEVADHKKTVMAESFDAQHHHQLADRWALKRFAISVFLWWTKSSSSVSVSQCVSITSMRVISKRSFESLIWKWRSFCSWLPLIRLQILDVFERVKYVFWQISQPVAFQKPVRQMQKGSCVQDKRWKRASVTGGNSRV